MNKRQFICCYVLMLIGSLMLAYHFSGSSGKAWLRFFVVWAADSYGDDINDTLVSTQFAGGWIQLQDLSGNGSCSINASQPMSFIVTVKINGSLLAVSSAGQADSNTRVNMTIVQADNASNIIWNNLTLNSTGTPSFTAPYWYVAKLGNWTSSLPLSGVTYNCTIVYQAFY